MNADTARMLCVVAAIAAENQFTAAANFLPVAAHFLAHCGQPCADIWEDMETYIPLPQECCPLFQTMGDVAAYLWNLREHNAFPLRVNEYLKDAYTILMANTAATADDMPEKEISDVAACLMYATIHVTPAAYVNAAMQRVYGQ